MIVFSGPTTAPSKLGLEWSRLGNPAHEPIWIVQHEPPERTIKPNDLIKQKEVNLSDLANITIEVLCRLQLLYHNNTQEEWIWELSDVNISDIVEALGLDGYVALSDVIILPIWYKALMTVLFIGCLILAGFGNLRMLIAIGIRKSSWTSTNVLIGALALSDLLTVSCTTPTEISFVIHDLSEWDFGPVGCVTFPFLQSAAILSNALILCLIAYDRYVCVVKMQPNTINARQGWTTLVAIIVVWTVSISIAMPSFWLWRVYYFIVVDDIPDPEIGMDFCSVFPSCRDNNELGPLFFPVYHVVLCGAIFVPLFLFFTVLYGRIGHFLWVRTPIGTGDSSNLQLARKKRIAWALFWLVFWFFFCRMPNWIFVMVTMFQEESITRAQLMLKSLLVFLSVLNTVVNPWLYSQLNEPLKQTIKTCGDKCCSRFFTFKNCFQVSPSETTNDSQQKIHRRERDQNEQVNPKEQHVERQSISKSVKPNNKFVAEVPQKVKRSSINDGAISTVSQTIKADVTRSSSKNGKTRQTYLE